MVTARFVVPDRIFVLGFAGNTTNQFPDEWIKLTNGFVTVVGRSEYQQALRVPQEINIIANIDYADGFEPTLEKIKQINGSVLVLASGDPGFFGPVRRLRQLLPNCETFVAPAPSSVSQAAARLAINYEDATVVSFVGRDPSASLNSLNEFCVQKREKLFVLTPSKTAIRTVISHFANNQLPYKLDIFMNLGFQSELHVEVEFPIDDDFYVKLPDTSYAVVVARMVARGNRTPMVVASAGNLAVNTSESSDLGNTFNHTYISRGSMITKIEIRQLVIAKLAPWRLSVGATIWDLGAGSGSVGLDALRIRPDLNLIAVDNDPSAIDMIKENANNLGLQVTAVLGNSEKLLNSLKPPEAVFIGGGGSLVIEQVIELLGNGVQIVASSVTLAAASKALELLGNQIMVQIHHITQLGKSGNRLDGYNPIFISWKDAT